MATRVDEIAPGVFHWRVHDERIDYLSAAHAVRTAHGTVLIDPLPLADEALGRLGEVTAICLSCGSHQRSAWRLRRQLGVAVHAPALSQTLEQRADVSYGDGDRLPGGLRAVFTPGAGTSQHTFLLEREQSVAFVPDLLVWPPGEERLAMLSTDEYYDLDLARRSIEQLLDLPIAVLCLAHGVPVLDTPKAAIRAALDTPR